MKSFKDFVLTESTNKQSFLEKYKENKDKAINAIKRLLSKAKEKGWTDIEKSNTINDNDYHYRIIRFFIICEDFSCNNIL